MLGVVYAAVYTLRLYQTSMNGPLRARSAERARLSTRETAMLAPLVAAMLLLALWPAGLVGATEAALARAIAPAQVAADRPPEQIAAPVPQNPPPSHLPLPGDPLILPPGVEVVP